MEQILRQDTVDLIGLCRPLISEPDLPNRWLAGWGRNEADCTSCNSCLYDMWTQVERGEPWVATCLVKNDRARVRAAQRWLESWVEQNRRPGQSAGSRGQN